MVDKKEAADIVVTMVMSRADVGEMNTMTEDIEAARIVINMVAKFMNQTIVT